jgi:hypothetical protein
MQSNRAITFIGPHKMQLEHQSIHTEVRKKPSRNLEGNQKTPKRSRWTILQKKKSPLALSG